MKIYTLGHSTRDFEEFLSILKKFEIQLVVDVRRFPSSKKFPWFNKENLEKKLMEEGIQYLHFAELGGYREEGYETFSKSGEFSQALNKLMEIVKDKVVAIICAEFFWWRCHRKYIANALVEKGFEVVHILDEGKIQQHKLREKETEEKMKLKLFCDKKARKLKRMVS